MELACQTINIGDGMCTVTSENQMFITGHLSGVPALIHTALLRQPKLLTEELLSCEHSY